MNLPINLLPIKRPLESESEEFLYFYNNVIQYLIPNIIHMMNVGIPINLHKVKELEEILDNILDNVKDKLKNNDLILEYLQEESSYKQKDLIKSIKYKTAEDFIKPFNLKNKLHRTWLINTWLTMNRHTDKIMPDWPLKDLKKLCLIIYSPFLESVLKGQLEALNGYVEKAMQNLAEKKAELYNKQLKVTKTSKFEGMIIDQFNPGSTVQKKNFLYWLDIESENTTGTGASKWDRTELEKLYKKICNELEDRDVTKNS